MKRYAVALSVLVVLFALCFMFPAYADGGVYDGVSWNVTDGVLTIGVEGQTQTLTNRSYRSQSDWPWTNGNRDVSSIRVVGNVVAQGSLSYMFSYPNFIAGGVDLSGLDTTNVTDMSLMFTGLFMSGALDVSWLDVSNVTNMNQMFYGNTASVIIMDDWDTSSVTDMSYMFAYTLGLSDLDLSMFDTTSVTDMSYMFHGSGVDNVDISSFTTAQADVSYMFYECVGLRSVVWPDVFDMSGQPFLYSFFEGCTHLETIDLSSWKSSELFVAQNMFKNCDKLKSITFGNSWTMAGVSNFKGMFSGCSSLESLDIAGWTLSTLVNDFDDVFKGCSSLTTLDLSGWNTRNIRSCNSMFEGCTSLSSLNISGWNLVSMQSMNRLFYGCKALESLDLSSWNPGSVSSMNNIFTGCVNLVQVELGSANPFVGINDAVAYLPATTSTVAFNYTGKWVRDDGAYGPYTPEELADNYDGSTMLGTWILEKEIANGYVVYDDSTKTAYFVESATDDMYAGGSVQTVLSVSGNSYTGTVYPISFNDARTWNAIASSVEHVLVVDALKPHTTAGWFTAFSACDDFDIGMLNMSAVQTMDAMFNECTSLTSFVWPESDTSQVTSMVSMFNGCKNLVTLDVSELDTGSVTSMRGMFSGCASLSSLDLSAWNVSNLETTNYMFNACKSLDTVDTTNWETSSLRNVSTMFYYAVIDHLDLSHWDTSHVTDLSEFGRGAHIGTLNLSNWDVSNVTTTYDFLSSFCGHLIMPDMHWDNLTSASYMFAYGEPGGFYEIPRWSFGKLNSLSYAFGYGNAKVSAPDWNLDGVTDISNMFRMQRGSGFYSDDLSGWHSTTVESAACMFNYTDHIEVLDLSNWDMPALTNIGEMFGYAKNLKSIIGLETWDVSKIRNMSSLFSNCSDLCNIDLSTWRPLQLENARYMFGYCDGLVSLDLSNFETPHLVNAGSMFYECSNLEYLDISGFDMTHVTDMGSMFDCAYKLNTVVFGGKSLWDTDPSYTAGSSTELPTLYPDQIPKGRTNKWIREDYLYGPYTPTELRTEYVPAMAGTWILDDRIGAGYTVIFEAPEGTVGSMPPVFAQSSSMIFNLPVNKFRRPGAYFDHWLDEESGRQYTTSIYKDTYVDGQIVVLKAVFSGEGGEAVEMSDGGFDFSLKKDQKAIFKGLPVNTAYQVYEQTPSGWTLICEADSSGVIEGNGASSALFVNEFIPNQCALVLSGNKFFDQSTANKNEFQFELLDESGVVVSTTTTGANGDIIFDALTFTESDVGREIYYTVREVLPRDTDEWQSTANESVTYDTHEERIKVIVSYQLSEDAEVVSHTDNFDDYGNRLDPIIELSDPLVQYYHSLNMNNDKERDMDTFRSDGSHRGDYENKAYASMVTIQNAAKLHLRIEYTNPRGNFYLWNGAYEAVKTGTWDSNCSPSTALRSFSGDVHDEIIVEELDIIGDSFSAYYISEPLAITDPDYNNLSNFGYHITVTVTEFLKPGGRRANGSLISDYSSMTNMSDVITIPGAEKLHVEMTYSEPRGYFWVWEGSHPSVASGIAGFDDEFTDSTAIKSYSWTMENENKVLTDSFDVNGDSLSVLYYSSARYQTDPLYGENVNYGYCMKVTPVGLSGKMSGYNVTSGTPNVWADGTQHGNYVTGKDYVDVVSIPGAKSLVVRLMFDMGSNDRLRLFSGSHSDYDNNTASNSSHVIDCIGSVSEYTTYVVNDDTATIIFHADENSTGGSGYGYHAIVFPSNVLGTLHADAEYDDDGAVFQNRSGTGYLSLSKISDDQYVSDQEFGFELAFYDEFGQLSDLDTNIEYHTDVVHLPTNLVTIYHIGRKGDGEDAVLYTERYPQIQSGESFTIKAKSFNGFVYSENDFVDNLPADGVVATADDHPVVIKLYYEAVPHTLTIKYQLLNANNSSAGVPDIETMSLNEGVSFDIAFNQYDGYSYVGNTWDLAVSGDKLIGGKMPGFDTTIVVKYRVARRVNLSKGATGNDLTYRIMLDRYEGLPTINGITFVDGVADVTLAGDGTVFSFDVPAGTRMTISSLDDSTFSARVVYNTSQTAQTSNTYSSRTSYLEYLSGVGPYNIELFEYNQVSLWFNKVIRKADGTEVSVGSGRCSRFPGEKIGYMDSNESSRESIYDNGNRVYYCFNNEQDPSPDTIMPVDITDFNATQWFVPSVKISVSMVRISNNGTQSTTSTTVYRAKNRDVTFNVNSYYGYRIVSVECLTDPTLTFTYNNSQYSVSGHVGDQDELQIRVTYQQN